MNGVGNGVDAPTFDPKQAMMMDDMPL